MAGGGLTLQNITAILEETGVSELHGTAGRVVVMSQMKYRPLS
eukprot:CAMPEP_0197520804 /NCGR_PEP_ID=MMETSP1318-20131121/6128_1 /TAXON_ID=552666 /ORGANISM="Partenskyella glossopodia, Strain RCC365" /LENGTH=42 /DNA_ID= /DNA_START= /DNA_END= /DNA_ORIENTATION=